MQTGNHRTWPAACCLFGAHRRPARTWVRIKGRRYGAWADQDGPLGGGRGYRRIVTAGDFTVRTIEELIAALAKARAGQVVFLPGDAIIDCTEFVHIEKLVLEIPGGVILAGDRGRQGSLGALIESDALATRPLLRAAGAGVRITGLRIKGPDPKRRLEHHARCVRRARPGDHGFDHRYYYQFPISTGIAAARPGLEVDNCEIAGFSLAGVDLSAGDRHRIHHAFIHHCQYNGLGYGVCLDRARALIDHNLFNDNRHSIAGTGRLPGGYDALHNVELGRTLSHCFDMHGGRDRQDGTDIAGERLRIANNLFLPALQLPVCIRGVPRAGAIIEANWFARACKIVAAGNTRAGSNAYGLRRPRIYAARVRA